MAMEDLNAMFSYQETVQILKQRIVTMTYELQIMKVQKDEEVRKHRESMEDMKQLLDLLQVAHKERDEARVQLQKLLNNLHPTTVNAALGLPVLSPESPLLINYGRTSSGTTDSNSFSDTTPYYNNNNPSQGDSLYDVISPVISAPVPPAVISRGADKKKMIDTESRIIYNISKGKTLPQKGKLLDAVMEAGPLLKSLMVAAPLPRWRNPPPAQPIEAPPMDFDNDSVPPSLRKPLNNLVSGFASSDLFYDSALNFTASGLNSARGLVSPDGVGLSQIFSTLKRQRIQ